MANRRATPLQFYLDLVADVVIEHCRERHELGDQLTVDAQQDVAGFELAVRGRIGNYLFDHQHPGLVGERRAYEPLGFVCQPQACDLIICLGLEHRLQGATRNRLSLLDQRKRTLYAVERQEEAAGRRVVRAGVQRHDLAVDVDHRRA